MSAVADDAAFQCPECGQNAWNVEQWVADEWGEAPGEEPGTMLILECYMCGKRFLFIGDGVTELERA